MAGRRKAEIQLQMQIESQEEWEELLSKEGLNVVDVYQEWCGPCSGMVANLRRLKNELGDDLLRFATAKADMIDSLDKYRGHCEPCFLFYAIKDPFIAQLEAKEKETDKEEEEEEEEGVKEVTVALIKPDAVEAGKVDQILEDDFFEDLVKFMTSGPSHVLALTKGKTGENIIDEFRDLIGPTDVEEAKTQKPERELAFFFPDFVAPHVDGKAPKLQRTLALVRPEAFRLHKDEIIDRIHEAGFRIAARKETKLSKEIAEEFYADHKDKDYYNDLIEHMTSIRATYGESILKNAVHGSSDPEHAKKTIKTIFGDLKFTPEGAVLETIDEEAEKDEEEEKTDEQPSTEQKTDEQPSTVPRRFECVYMVCWFFYDIKQEEAPKEEKTGEEKKEETQSEEKAPDTQTTEEGGD
ncbi:NME8 [Mytilus coruscus]|uniref:NME8 n=1 Tax=Mytilus coruscus TaxID=42192 RepID=A0A6J8BIY3_MYTCO|nr:NME8 [Mytilus coruscus]